MHASYIVRHGGPEEIRFGELPDPKPAPGEVLVRVISSSVNPADLRARSPQAQRTAERTFPLTLGYDFCGTVAAVGPDVDRWRGRRSSHGLS
jgi:NADPH:quinone reductase